MNNIALIIGINGQDGTFLAKYLVSKNYVVYGITKKNSKLNINILLKNLIEDQLVKIFQTNILDLNVLKQLIRDIQPSEIYYLATTHELSINKKNYNEIMSINVSGLMNVLEIIKSFLPKSKVFYASSSNVFVNAKESPQLETTERFPETLYGVAKLTAMNLIDLYKREFKIFVCYGILYNHESTLRKKNFLPMKIVDAVVNIKYGSQKKLFLGSLDDKRDWGWAFDYVKAMWLMLQNHKPENYLIGSGSVLTVKDILSYAFGYVDLNWKEYVVIDPSLVRENKKVTLVADVSKIKSELNWSSSKTFKKVVEEMIDYKIKMRNFRNDKLTLTT
tara:strand:- start:13756 stop:14754 length:999 start_codon:yes stop_codon:yes gene_type:complete